jgi:Uma2 family endonuclease
MATTTRHMTYDDLMAMPEDDALHELIRGEIWRMPPPKGKHGLFEARLVAAIDRYLSGHAMARGWDERQGSDARDLLVGAVAGGEVGIRFSLPDDSDQVRGLDVCYLSPEQVARHAGGRDDEYFGEVPALVAEVISLSETASYVDEKVRDYLAGGARLVWLLYPKTRTVQVFRPGEPMVVRMLGDLLDGADVLPGFSVAVASLFT